MAKNAMKGLPWILKIILVILYDIQGILQRLLSGNVTSIIVAIIMFLTGNLFGIMWIIDLITILVKKDITVLA